jgi:hypothetical protein
MRIYKSSTGIRRSRKNDDEEESPTAFSLDEATSRWVDPQGRRAALRFDVRIPITYHFDIGRRSDDGKGWITDISTSGAKISDPTRLPPVGSSIRLWLSFYETSTPVAISCRCVRHAEDRAFAVRFHSRSAFVASALRLAISRIRQRDPDDDPSTLF